MWEISGVLLCAFVLKFNALELNSSSLESKLDTDICPPEFIYEPLNKEELKYVVSVGIFYNGENYAHICFGTMITVLHALSLYYCDRTIYVRDLTRGMKKNQRFFIALHRSQDTINKNYPVGKFEYLDDYLPPTVRRIYTRSTGIAVLRLMVAVRFLTSLRQFPVYESERENSRGEIIAYNYAEYHKPSNYSVKRSFIKMDITAFGDSRFQEDPENVDGFYVKLNSKYHFLTESDKGSPVLIDNKFVGIVTDVNKGVVTNVYRYGRYFNEIRNKLGL